MIRPRSSGPHQHRAVAVETLERRRLLAGTPLVEFTAPTYSTDAVPALQIAGSYAFFQIAEPGNDFATGTVDYTVGGGTATPGVDYEPIHGTVTLNANNNYGFMFSLPIIDHAPTGTPSQTVNLTLSNPTGGLAIGTPGTAVLTINEPLATTATTTALAASASPASLGAPVVFTAFVTRTALGTGDPTGTVTFTVDGVAQPPVAVQQASASLPEFDLYDQATAQFSTASLGMGTHTITASYSGDSTATASTGTLAETVGQATTTTVVGQSTGAAAFGQPIVFTAVVNASNPAAGTPTGTVTFNIDQFVTLLPSPPPNPPEPEPIEATATVTLVPTATPGQAIAQFTIATLSKSIDHPVNVTYSGDTRFATSVGYGGVTVGNGTTTALGASSTASVTGQPVVFTAVVTTSGPANELTGTVQFLIDNVAQTPVAITPSATSPLQATAQFTSAPLAAGPHLITAVYSGNVTSGTSNEITGETIGSTSPTLVVQTAAATTSPTPPTTPTASDVELSYSSAAPVAGQPFLLVATTLNPATLPVVPTGQAEFLDGNTVLGTLPLDAAGNAVFYFPALAAGLHLFHVVYGGDANYAASLDSTETLIATVPTPPAVTTLQRGSQISATVTLGFSSPLDPTVAQKASNYRITTPAGQAIKVKSAIYDPTAVTVTLHLASRLNSRLAYNLHVAAGGTTYTGVIPRLLYFGVTPQSTVSSTAIATTHPRARLATQLHVAARVAHAKSAR